MKIFYTLKQNLVQQKNEKMKKLLYIHLTSVINFTSDFKFFSKETQHLFVIKIQKI